MSKRDLIDHIRRLNPTADAAFLARFSQENLLAYLQHLQEVETDRRRTAGREPVAVG